MPSAPLRVSQLVAARGDEAIGAVMTVTDADVAVDGSLQLSDAPLVQIGMAVQIEDPDLGIRTSGTVHWVAERPGTNGVDGFHVYFEILVEDPPANLVGASVQLTVPVETTADTVLAVPVSALSLAVGGTSRVQVDRDGVLEVVRVDPGLSAAGFVEVTPLHGELVAGDLVVVAFERAGPAAGG